MLWRRVRHALLRHEFKTVAGGAGVEGFIAAGAGSKLLRAAKTSAPRS